MYFSRKTWQMFYTITTVHRLWNKANKNKEGTKIHNRKSQFMKNNIINQLHRFLFFNFPVHNNLHIRSTFSQTHTAALPTKHTPLDLAIITRVTYCKMPDIHYIRMHLYTCQYCKIHCILGIVFDALCILQWLTWIGNLQRKCCCSRRRVF